MAALTVEGLTKRFGGLTVTDDVSFQISAGEIHALIGPNGAGKSTLIAQISGRLRPDRGRIFIGEDDVTAERMPSRVKRGLVQSFQVPSLFDRFTVAHNVMIAVQARQRHSYSFLRNAMRFSTINAQVEDALRGIGILDWAARPVAGLSHGERRYVEIALTLAARPKVLLLDEPLAGLSRTESDEMVDLIASLKRWHAIVLVEHDMGAVFALADRVTVLVQGRIIASGDPAEVRQNAAVREAYLGDDRDLVHGDHH